MSDRTMIRLAIAGAAGRMGRCILTCASRDERFTITTALTSSDCPYLNQTVCVDNKDLLFRNSLEEPCDVLIDFTLPAGTMHWLEVCASKKIPMVIGATGHTDQQIQAIEKVSTFTPIVKAPNCSVGIQAITNILKKLAKELGAEYDVEIVETHHRNKIDAPSGTALALAQAIAKATHRSKDDFIIGRSGQTGPRPDDQIAIHSVRMGEIVGQHEIHFSGLGETVTVRHTAHSRDTFAAGALRAASWIIHQPPGLYSMKEVLKMKD